MEVVQNPDCMVERLPMILVSPFKGLCSCLLLYCYPSLIAHLRCLGVGHDALNGNVHVQGVRVQSCSLEASG